MDLKKTFCVVLTTCPTQEEADNHALTIVKKQYGACVQSYPIRSHYMWEGKVQSDTEFLLLIKTTGDQYEKLEQYIKAEHSYDVPQLIQLPIENGLAEYLDWIKVNTKSGDE